MQTSLTKRLLIAAVIAVPMSFTAGDVLAQSCKSGGCGGPNNLEKAIAKVESAGSTVSNADLQTAYEKIETVAQEADDLNAAGNSKVRGGLKELANKLEQRANAELEEAIANYFEGYMDDSLAKFEELSKLKGLPSAKKAKRELDKENDRAAWRLANELATKFVEGGDYADARSPLNDMQRLARRTDYSKQTSAAITSFTNVMLHEVEAAEKMIAQEQYLDAYTTLLEISRLSHARQSAVAARKILAKNASVEGMRFAKAEYEATDALSEAKTWFTSLGDPSPREQQQYQQKLEAIANGYKGTSAAEQAEQMILSADAQAAR